MEPGGYQAQPEHPGSDTLSQVALWSMIIGILGMCIPLICVAALIMGIVGIGQTTGGKRRGMGFAIAGTVLGAFGILGTCLSVGILLPAIGQARVAAQTVLSEARLEQIAIGMTAYYDDMGSLPPAESWKPTLSDYLVGTPDDPIFTSPMSDGDAVEYVFAPGNFAFDGTQIMFYEDPDHRTLDGDVIVALDDGSVLRISEEQLVAELTARGLNLER